jgi:tRNA-Thr(GGU) m(6)t(6)A37 methyltransferase TsaA
MSIILHPIATIKNNRATVSDDNWGEVESQIILADEIPEEAFNNIERFSHLEIVYYFHKLGDSKIVYSRHPRDNPDFPDMGLLAQRTKDRPNRIGLCTVELIEHKGRSITVRMLDAIDGTPVLDIKPVFKEFQPAGKIRQPEWVSLLMKEYWAK